MPQFTPNTEELKWAAGLFDGEGTIGVRKNGNKSGYRRIGIGLGMTDHNVVRRFADAVQLGVLREQPYVQSKYPSAKPVWRWRADNFEEVQAVVAQLWSWLSGPKREQARRAILSWRSQPHKNNGRRRKVGQ